MIDSDLIACFKTHDAVKLKQLIKDLLSDSTHRNKDFKKHPLGFLHLKLYQNETEQIRLHLWSNENSNQDNRLLIHSHGFDLKSFLYYGVLENISYLVTSVSRPTTNRMYEVVYEEDRSILVRTDDFVEIKERDRDIISQGQFYSIVPGAYHKSRVVSDLAISIVYTRDDNKAIFPKVVGENIDTEEIEFKRTEVQDQDIRKWQALLKN